MSHVDKAPVTVTTSATPSSLIVPDGTNKINDEIFVKYAGVRPSGTVTVNRTARWVAARELRHQSVGERRMGPRPGGRHLVTDQSGTYVGLIDAELHADASGHLPVGRVVLRRRQLPRQRCGLP